MNKRNKERTSEITKTTIERSIYMYDPSLMLKAWQVGVLPFKNLEFFKPERKSVAHLSDAYKTSKKFKKCPMPSVDSIRQTIQNHSS